MAKDKYVAYVSTYTEGSRDGYGIKIYDVDVKNGRFTEKGQVKITNSSYLSISHNKKYLYSLTDFGVEAYKILEDGSLELINKGTINGMRGHYLSTDYEDKYLFTGGYHDGKITVLHLNEDGGIGAITDEIYHKGLGSIAERNFRPHISCVKMTRDNRFLCVPDLGMDNTYIYKMNHETGKLKQVDIVHSDQESAPRHIKISKDGTFMYVIQQQACQIDVYKYDVVKDLPYFEKIQTISTLNDYHAGSCAASALNLSLDFKYMVASNAGDNSVIMYEIDPKEGYLKKCFCLPISGDYPKDAALFPDNKHLVSLNHESDTMTFFAVDPAKGTMVMNGKEIKVEKPNCVVFHKL